MIRQQQRSPAIDAANKFFKQTPDKNPTDYEKVQLDFNANRERLKAERLTRESERQTRSDTAE